LTPAAGGEPEFLYAAFFRFAVFVISGMISRS
jgi:hypothetical protein